jgi:hypothetical protein
MEEAAKTLAQTALQDGHIIRNPSPSKDIAPATSADKPPVSIALRGHLPSIQFSSSHADLHRLSQREEEDEEIEETASEISLEESPHVIEPTKPRRQNLPPIPDLRFEQSYLKQLEAAQGSVFWMIFITIREQVLFPGLQGFVWALAVTGIRSLRASQAENGRAWGSWVRDWFGQITRKDSPMNGPGTGTRRTR